MVFRSFGEAGLLSYILGLDIEDRFRGSKMNEPKKRAWADSKRERYWNEDYVRYWKARVEEANKSGADTSGMVKGDAKTGADGIYIDAIGLLQIKMTDRVLELGCGFGRSLPVLCKIALEVAAVDISKEMIKTAREFCQEKNISFHVSQSEDLPFSDESFGAVVCFAAFDAMYQAEALIEMNRVSRTGARVLITAKNDDYYDDDSVALEAEIGARAKRHPNYFTDVDKLIKNIHKLGFDIQTQKYYLRRGDFAKQIAKEERPRMFYEYLIVLKKVKTWSRRECEDLVISGKISKTYARCKHPA